MGIKSYKFWSHRLAVKLFASKKLRLSEPPNKIMVSLTNRCNLRCWHCPRASYNYDEQDTPKKLIDYITAKILPRCKYLRIGGNTLGEPLLSENFNYFVSSLGFREFSPYVKEKENECLWKDPQKKPLRI